MCIAGRVGKFVANVADVAVAAVPADTALPVDTVGAGDVLGVVRELNNELLHFAVGAPFLLDVTFHERIVVEAGGDRVGADR